MRPKFRPGPRGVTLIEMLVVVALVVLIMTIIVSVFRAATGAMRVAQTSNDMDQQMRRLEATLRQDLLGVTARLTPPLDPKDGLGYLEYGENAPEDFQHEDSDDYISFTAKAPEGQPFTGRYWNPLAPANVSNPIIISSEYAEILYFVRNGNLYRRVLLIVPERKGAAIATSGNGVFNQFPFSGSVCGWLGVNDISAHPEPDPTIAATYPIVTNTLGDLTNRQNRFAHPRFTPFHGSPPAPGVPDDTNMNGVPDYYPTLYPNAIAAGLLNEPTPPPITRNTSLDVLPFPFVYPGAYSNPANARGSSNLGPAHNLFPANHSPLETGDSLGTPANTTGGILQTYWGWPTWKETASPLWFDPMFSVTSSQFPGLTYNSANFQPLPPMTSQFRPTAQLFNDGAGSNTFATPAALWLNTWEDDLIMTGVRSFDIKAFDQVTSTYLDLADPTPLVPPLPLNFITQNSFKHEGRMPPLPTDFRFDPQFPAINIGENLANNNTIRMTRVWDSWSTDYSNAPSSPYDVTLGPANNLPPVYPSYPPPYPAGLRGIQIQIRIANQPDNDRLRVLTIRHDFSDKL